jgi:hypothetical protein
MTRYVSRRKHVDVVYTNAALGRGEIEPTGWLKDAFDSGKVRRQGDGYASLVLSTKSGDYVMPINWCIVRHADGTLEGMRPDVVEREYELEMQ